MIRRWRERAATALDATHVAGERGPRTYMARWRVASALDRFALPRCADVLWLESVARIAASDRREAAPAICTLCAALGARASCRGYPWLCHQHPTPAPEIGVHSGGA